MLISQHIQVGHMDSLPSVC